MRNLMLKVYLLLAVLVTAITIWVLQLSEPLFRGAWLKPALFPSLSEKIWFASLVFVFSLAAVGLWLFAWTKILGIFKIHPVKRVVAASLTLLAAVSVDTLVRYRIAEVWGSGLSLEAVTASVSSPAKLALDLWRWYQNDVLLCLFGVAGFAALMAAANHIISRKLKNPGNNALRSRGFSAILLLSTSAVILMVTVLLTRWPTAISQVTKTSIGYSFTQLASWTTDFDGDGWGYFDIPPDTRPFDKRCKPFAIDIPNDGIDENLLAGDLQLSDALEDSDATDISLTEYPPVSFRHTPNVLVVFMESVRFDSIYKKIDGKKVMPNFQRMIREGALAPQHAFASQGYTYSSVLQFLYGGFQSSGSTVFDDFKSNDYETAVFSGYDLEEEKFERHMPADFVFDPRKDKERAGRFNTAPADRLVEKIDGYLSQRDTSKPFFLFSFFVDPHFPYKQVNTPVLCKKHIATKDIRPANREEVARSYFDQVHHVDTAAGKLLHSLKKHGVDDSTIVIFVSDHGESLYDDGITIGHGIAINDVMTQLAMLVLHSPIDVPDVISHHHMRDLLRDMLSTPGSASPTLAPMPHRKLFQYIGNLHYPSQIGLWSLADGRLLYDLKKNELFDVRQNLTGIFKAEAAGEAQDTPDGDLMRRGKSLIRKWETELYLSRKPSSNPVPEVAELKSHKPAPQNL